MLGLHTSSKEEMQTYLSEDEVETGHGVGLASVPQLSQISVVVVVVANSAIIN